MDIEIVKEGRVLSWLVVRFKGLKTLRFFLISIIQKHFFSLISSENIQFLDKIREFFYFTELRTRYFIGYLVNLGEIFEVRKVEPTNLAILSLKCFNPILTNI